MIFLIDGFENDKKEKYTQLRLAHQFGGISTVGFTQTLWVMLKNDNDRQRII